jgi:hypothetical protein
MEFNVKNLAQMYIPVLLFVSLISFKTLAQMTQIVGSYYLPHLTGTQQPETLFIYKSDGTLEVTRIFGGQRDKTINTYEVTGNTLRLGKPETVVICPGIPKADQSDEGQVVSFKKVGDTLLIIMDGFKFPFEAATPEQIARIESIPLCQ